MDEADAVRVVADQLAVLNDDGIAGTNQFSSRRQFIEVLSNGRLAGHGDVKTADVQGADSLNDVRQLIDLYIE